MQHPQGLSKVHWLLCKVATPCFILSIVLLILFFHFLYYIFSRLVYSCFPKYITYALFSVFYSCDMIYHHSIDHHFSFCCGICISFAVIIESLSHNLTRSCFIGRKSFWDHVYLPLYWEFMLPFSSQEFTCRRYLISLHWSKAHIFKAITNKVSH
jgi:hypothetical protein